MKEKILIILIFILIIAIIIINFSCNKSNKNKAHNVGQVKSAVSSNNDFSFIKNINKIPTKKEGFIDANNLICASSFSLLDIDSGNFLAEENANTAVPIASTTKIMTSIIVFENYKMDDIVTISQEAQQQIGSYTGFIVGEKITVKELLHCLLLMSSNEAAYALAEHMGYSTFIEKMNEKAIYLGATNTHFKDPAGLDDTGLSTAHDMALISSYAFKNKELKDIATLVNYTAQSIDGKVSHPMDNSNRLVLPNELFYYEPTLAGKTGYTPDAGHCLVAAAQKNGHTLISVILNTNEDSADASAKETKRLFEWGFNNYTWK